MTNHQTTEIKLRGNIDRVNTPNLNVTDTFM